MDKKWSCPACEYKTGRRSNVERHIERKHGNYVLPVLTEFRLMDPHHQASQYYSDRYFPQQPPEALVKSAKEKKDEAFISSYKFQDKRLGICKKFLDATKLSPSKERNLIIEDLMLQMEWASSNKNQFWLDPFENNGFNYKNLSITKRFGSNLASKKLANFWRVNFLIILDPPSNLIPMLK